MPKDFIRHGACCGGITPEYYAWMRMHNRCRHAKGYKDRGIKVCERWQTFPPFLADMGQKPTPAHSLERKNNEKGYSPKNCRWATRKEQARNRRSTVYVTLKGRRVSLAEACETTGTNYDAAKYRVTVGKPFNQPLRITARDYHG